MAKSKHNGNKKQRANNNSLLLTIGVGILVLGGLALASFQFFGLGQSQESNSAAGAAADNSGALEVTSLDERGNLEAVTVEAVTDREARYLGPASDPATLELAEAGQLDQPTLAFFHADW